MKTIMLLGAAALLSHSAFSATVSHSSSQFFNDKVDLGGMTYEISVNLDVVNYGNGSSHKAYIKPEEYKLKIAPELIRGKITCPAISGPGLKGFDGSDARKGLACSWKSKPGNNATVTQFNLPLKNNGNGVQPRFKRFNENSKTLKGTFAPTDANGELTGESYKLYLTMDVVDYRNGNSHKAFIKSERAGHSLDESALANGWRVTGCSNGMKSNGVDGIYGKRPKVTCELKRGNGNQPSHNEGTVVLK
jgi:hypothetical protein